MTYYDLVLALDNLKDKPRDENIFNSINSKKLDFSGNILGRFEDKIRSFILYRLNNANHKIVESISQSILEQFNLDLIEFYKEIKYLKMFTTLNILTKENKVSIEKFINKLANDIINNLLSICSKFVDKDKYISLIKSYN